ncbi:MAG: hypothetical protein OER21_09675 [Gemmatimonadota bacterium]|nr:hypothetical protein [Gemmatimonadota bacterium]
MLWVIVAILAGAAAAIYVYAVRERLGAAAVGLAMLRTAALAALLLLLVNAARTRWLERAPTVLLDASLSLQAAGGQWTRARDTARSLAGRAGTVLRLAEGLAPFDTTEPDAGRSLVASALRAVTVRGPVVVVTDGELEDVAGLPDDLREATTVVLVPRDTVPDVALTEVVADRLVTPGDTVHLTIELATWGALPDTMAGVEVRAAGRQLLQTRVPLPPAPGRGRRALALPPGALRPGTHVLEVQVTAAGDREPRDDVRMRLVTVSATPTIVLVASPPDWESRFLARELQSIIPAGVRAYAEPVPGRWLDMTTQRVVPAARVTGAAGAATLVIVRGAWRPPVGPRARWDWPGDGGAGRDAVMGDWYVTGQVPGSPLAAGLSGFEWDSLPPLTSVLPWGGTPNAWVALAARAGRRGADRPVLVGTDSGGVRVLTTMADGWWRWAHRGGAAREAYRGLVAAGADWLLGAAGRARGGRVVASDVVPRGVPVSFAWRGDKEAPAVLRVDVEGADSTFARALPLDPAGIAELRLPPGTYRWRVRPADATGWTVVESYSSEFHPGPVVAAWQAAAVAPRGVVGAREVWWIFAVALVALLAEWAWRTRRGLP